jgi:hypothetical protein
MVASKVRSAAVMVTAVSPVVSVSAEGRAVVGAADEDAAADGDWDGAAEPVRASESGVVEHAVSATRAVTAARAIGVFFM